jgi:hypothetical protein
MWRILSFSIPFQRIQQAERYKQVISRYYFPVISCSIVSQLLKSKHNKRVPVHFGGEAQDFRLNKFHILLYDYIIKHS